jgi:hypothetical protein
MPAGNTYQALATVYGTGSSAVISITGIPQTYTDLIVEVSGRLTGATAGAYIDNVNGSSSNLLSGNVGYGTGSANAVVRYNAGTNWNLSYINSSIGSTNPLQSTVHIYNYASTLYFKNVYIRSTTNTSTEMTAGSYSSTNAISSFNLSSFNGSAFWTTDSYVTVYGVTAA